MPRLVGDTASEIAQYTGKPNVNATASVRARSNSMDRSVVGLRCPGEFGITTYTGTVNLQSPDAVSAMNFPELTPSAMLPRISSEPRSTNSSGLKRTNHHSARNPITSTEPRARKRAWGLGGDIRGTFGTRHAIPPQPKKYHRIQHEQAFPQIVMREVEAGPAVLTQIKQANKANDVEDLKDQAARYKTNSFQSPRRGKRYHRRPQQNRHVQCVAAIFHFHRKSTGRIAQHGPLDTRRTAANADQCV